MIKHYLSLLLVTILALTALQGSNVHAQTTTTAAVAPFLNISFYNSVFYSGSMQYGYTYLNYPIPVGLMLNATFTVSPSSGLNFPSQLYFNNANYSYGYFVFTPTAAGNYTVNVNLVGSAAGNYTLASASSFVIQVKAPGNVLVSNFSYIKTQGDSWTVSVALDSTPVSAPYPFNVYISTNNNYIYVNPYYVILNSTAPQTFTFTAVAGTPVGGTTIYFYPSDSSYALPANLANGFTMFVTPTTAAPTTSTATTTTTTTTAGPTTTTTTSTPTLNITFWNTNMYLGQSYYATTELNYAIPVGQVLNATFTVSPATGLNLPNQIYFVNSNSTYGWFVFTPTAAGTYTVNVALSGSAAANYALVSPASFTITVKSPGNVLVSNFSYIKTQGDTWTVDVSLDTPLDNANNYFSLYISASYSFISVTPNYITFNATTLPVPTQTLTFTALGATPAYGTTIYFSKSGMAWDAYNLPSNLYNGFTMFVLPTTAAPTTTTTAGPTTSAAPTTTTTAAPTAAPTTTTTAVPQVQITWINPVQCDGTTSNVANIYLTQPIPAGQTLNINFFPPSGILIPSQISLTSNNSQYHGVYYTASNGGTIDVTLSGTSAGGFFNLYYPNNYVTLGCVATTAAPTTAAPTTAAPTTAAPTTAAPTTAAPTTAAPTTAAPTTAAPTTAAPTTAAPTTAAPTTAAPTTVAPTTAAPTTAAPTTAAPTTAAPTTAAPTTAAPTTAAPTTAAPTTAAPTTAAPTTAAPTTAAPTTAAPTTAAPTTAAPTTAAPTTAAPTTAAPTTTTAVPQVQFTWVNPVRCDGTTSNRAEIFLTQRIPAGQTLNINFFPPAGIQIPTQIALTSNNSQYHAVYYTASNGGTIDITLSGTSAGGFFNLYYPNNFVTLGCAATTTTTRPPTTTTTLAPTTTTSSLFPLDVDAIRITVFFGNTNCNRNKGTNLTATYSLNRCDKIGVIRTGGTYETAWTRTVCNGTSASFQIHTDKCLTSPELSLSYPVGVCHHNGVQSQLIECIKRASAGATSFALVLVSIVAIIFSVLMM